MAAVGLLYVGAVLFVNGLALAGLVRGTSMIPMNLFVGILQVITPLYLIFTANGNQATIVGASGLFLFGFTYLYVAMNNAFNLDGTGLGWFCLFVVFSACIYSFWNFTHAGALDQPVSLGATPSVTFWVYSGSPGPSSGSSSGSCSVSARPA